MLRMLFSVLWRLRFAVYGPALALTAAAQPQDSKRSSQTHLPVAWHTALTPDAHRAEV